MGADVATDTVPTRRRRTSLPRSAIVATRIGVPDGALVRCGAIALLPAISGVGPGIGLDMPAAWIVGA